MITDLNSPDYTGSVNKGRYGGTHVTWPIETIIDCQAVKTVADSTQLEAIVNMFVLVLLVRQ